MTSQGLLDLEWVLTSPSLVDDPLAAPPVLFDPSAVDEEHLAAFVDERGEHRVGRYFEHLLHYWLAHVRKVELIDVGRQILDQQRRTVGEIDFLYRDEDGALTHCEAAVKFFLHYPNAQSSHFPGPAARDNFERKANQLFDRQLYLSEKHVPDVEKRVGFVRGRVFERTGESAPEVLPPRMSAECLGGTWVREADLARLEGIGAKGFHFVQKPHWFAPVIDADILSWEQFASSIGNHFEGPAYPVMVSMRAADSTETQRCFVVPDAWPAENEASEAVSVTC